MPTRNINLTDRYEGLIADQLAAGRFQNASEVVRAALNMLEQKTAEDKATLEALRMEVLIGIKAYENGDYIEISSDAELDAFFNDVAAEVDKEQSQ